MGLQQTILSYKILVKNSSVLNEDNKTVPMKLLKLIHLPLQKKNEIEAAHYFLNVWLFFTRYYEKESKIERERNNYLN